MIVKIILGKRDSLDVAISEVLPLIFGKNLTIVWFTSVDSDLRNHFWHLEMIKIQFTVHFTKILYPYSITDFWQTYPAHLPEMDEFSENSAKSWLDIPVRTWV